MSRRRLPAPPLVLQPVFGRVRLGSSRARRLLDLADFLQQRGLLTDGGAINLSRGLLGRGEVLSLTTQDVRASAHGLALELLARSCAEDWPAVAESYYERYDRGKPRRPTRLQRLYLEWSSDCGWEGLLEACRSHPQLWGCLKLALPCQAPDDPDRLLLTVALETHEQSSGLPWRRAYQASPANQTGLLKLLPLLPHPTASERLDLLEAVAAERLDLDQKQAALLACRRDPLTSAVVMPRRLVELTLDLLSQAPGEVDARWLAALRGYSWPATSVLQLRQALLPQDPVHRIVYGPRPGRPWLSELIEAL